MNGWSIVTQSLSGEMHFSQTQKPEMVDQPPAEACLVIKFIVFGIVIWVWKKVVTFDCAEAFMYTWTRSEHYSPLGEARLRGEHSILRDRRQNQGR